MEKSNLTSIVLAIVMFIALAGFVYWVLGFFKFISPDWLRIVLALLITLIIGIIIYFRNKKLKSKK